MKKLLLIVMATCLIFSYSNAQINDYNHSPVIVGHQDLKIFMGEDLVIHPDSLIIGDLEQGNYSEYRIILQAGENYTIKGNTIIPAKGYIGILDVPCQVNDGELNSNVFQLEVFVYDGRDGYLWMSGLDLYVDPEGDDSNPGSLSKPFKTLERALEEVRKIKKGKGMPDRGISIYMMEGYYPVNSTIKIDAPVSGEIGKPLSIMAYPGEKVVFEGGNRLDFNSFKPISDPAIKARIFDKKAAEKVLEIDLTAAGITELGKSPRRGYGIGRREGPKMPEVALAVNGEIQTIARYPNESYNNQMARITDPKYSFLTYDSHVAKWTEAKDIWIDGSLCKPWEWSMNEVESINPQTLEIKLKHPEYSAMDSVWAIFHYKNLLEEIDMPGEYYIDLDDKKLYLLPGDEFSGSASIYLTALDEPMVEISENVSDIWFEGILFENGRDACMNIRGNRIKIRNCEVRCFSKSGITMAGKRNEIHGSHVHHIGMEGVQINDGREPNRKLIPSGNLIINTEINDYSMWHRAYTPGLRISGVGNGTSHCLIHNSPHFGISINGNDHVFEYSEVHHTPEEFSDMLSMYIITGNNPGDRGTVVRRNYFHDVGNKEKQGAGVYMDNETHGVGVHENFFHNSGGEKSGWSVMIHGGADNIVRNNIFVDCVFPFMISLRYNTYVADRFERTLSRWGKLFEERIPFYDTVNNGFLQRYPELAHFFDDDDGSVAETPYTFDFQKDEEGWVTNYWTRRTPSTNVFENNVVYNRDPEAFRLGNPLEGVREIREFYVVNGFRFKDGKLQDNLIHSNNHNWKSDPGFVDYKNKDFTIRKDAEVLEKIPGLDKIPFRKIGLR
ncbi:right-handed parallel beta-helix repeat-containing protein [Bacteroidota bacterium]